MARNPFKRIAESAKRTTEELQRLVFRMPAYKLEVPSQKVRHMDKHGRVRSRLAVGDQDGDAPPNAADLRALLQRSGYHYGRTITVTGILDGDYPGHEGETVITLAMRINRYNLYRALEDPRNRNSTDVINQISRGPLNRQWLAVYEVTILDEIGLKGKDPATHEVR